MSDGVGLFRLLLVLRLIFFTSCHLTERRLKKVSEYPQTTTPAGPLEPGAWMHGEMEVFRRTHVSVTKTHLGRLEMPNSEILLENKSLSLQL